MRPAHKVKVHMESGSSLPFPESYTGSESRNQLGNEGSSLNP